MDDKEIKKEGKGSKNNMQLVVLLIGVFVIAIVGTHFLNSNKTLKEAGFPYSSPDKATEITAESEIADTEINENRNIGDMFELATGYDEFYDYLESENKVNRESVNKTALQESKTVGKYSYKAEAGWITITDNTEEELKEDKFVPDFESPADIIKEMYVEDDRMLLISSHIASVSEGREETICYCYDVSNPIEPQLIGQMKQDGVYSASQKAGEIFYLFTRPLISKPELSKQEAILEENLKEWIPKINNSPVASSSIYLKKSSNEGGLISSFSINDPETTIDSKYFMMGICKEYISEDSLYLYESNRVSDRNITSIANLSFSEGKLLPKGCTMINGSIEASVSIRQEKGYLYTMVTDRSSSDRINSFYVFDQELKRIGAINDIAKGEEICIAEISDKYVCFKINNKPDALLKADISDPANPKLVTED